MANEERKDDHYPLDSNCYILVNEIGKGLSAIVYKAICTPVNNSAVAIKAIDLEKTKEDFDKVGREAKTMTLLNHPNILKSHCSFTVQSRLWVVMPFMAGGSLQSIMASSFPEGLSEPCIATVLKEILNALSYLHGQGHLHRDIKAGNILIDSKGNVKLADFGVSASIYERNLRCNSSGSSSSSSLMLNEVAGTPYWMAPEVIHSHTGYSLKADIWSFGITALELAHGRPPLSHLPPSKSLIMKITKRLRFSDHYEKTKDSKSKKFSKAFKDMVGLCLDQDPSRRPSAEKLLKHSFFKNCKGADFLVRNVLLGLPSVEQRFSSERSSLEESGDDDFSSGEIRKERRISGWSFNEEGFELDPVFPSDEAQKDGGEGGSKRVSFGGETVILEKAKEGSLEDHEGNSKRVSFGGETIIPKKENEGSLERSGINVGEGTVNSKILEGLLLLKNSVEFQKQQVTAVIETHFGEGSSEMNIDDHLMKVNQTLRLELENERQRRIAAETELELLKLQMASEQR